VEEVIVTSERGVYTEGKGRSGEGRGEKGGDGDHYDSQD